MKTFGMRYFLFLVCLFSCYGVLAQAKQVEPAQSVQTPYTSKKIQADCFVSKYDAGAAAMRRGDYRAAIRFFEAAKLCPEALNSPRRLHDLETLIDFCRNRLNGSKIADSEAPGKTAAASRLDNADAGGRKFYISAALRNNTDPNCFQLTVREANRAFRDSCWDDAAKLFRAAKTCTDATQADRERMNERIEACRAAAEDELMQKEQKAVRTARHALAANLADDAMDLLRQGHRSLAFRLADFANFYMAPDDNPDCLEAMFAASLFAPNNREEGIVRPPFAYHLTEDPSVKAQLKFATVGGRLYLYVYFPDEQRMSVWSLPEMRQAFDFLVPILQKPSGFDIAPDGGYLFFGDNFFFLPDYQLLEVDASGQYCFSEDGRTFFYEDKKDGIIRAVPISNPNAEAQQYKKNIPSRNLVVQEANIPVAANLISLHAYQGYLWMGYPDRVVCYNRQAKANKMSGPQVWMLQQIDPRLVEKMVLNPARRELLVQTDSAIHYGFLFRSPEGADTTWAPLIPTQRGRLMGYTSGPDTLLVFNLKPHPERPEYTFQVFDPANLQLLHQFNSSNLYYLERAALAPDGQWLATNQSGVILLWPLNDSHLKPPVAYPTQYNDRLSADGTYLFVSQDAELEVYRADQMANGVVQRFAKRADSYLPNGNSRQWAVFWNEKDQLELRHLINKRSFQFDVPQPDDDMLYQCSFAFDATENRYVAYAAPGGLVVVRSLETGDIVAEKTFTGIVTHILYAPGVDQLVVATLSLFGGRDQANIKIWDFAQPTAPIRSIRLNNYRFELIEIAAQGNLIAFSNRSDIHVFSLDNLENELIVLNPNARMSQLKFSPDGLTLAAGCEDGTVVIWDVVSGQRVLKFTYQWNGAPFYLAYMAYLEDGRALRLGHFGQVATIGLDASALRESLQSGIRWLQAFTPDQIRDYQLETAFRYPGNFDRLAQSGDFPLIRSFFDYFRNQSMNSNNIRQVRTYCERAFTLYELLENGQSAGNLKFTMLVMYHDYVVKSLLRNDPVTASALVAHLNRRFEQPSIATLDAAHTALLQRQLPEAIRLYTDYLLSNYNSDVFEYEMTEISSDLLEFQEADLLDSSQINCICTVFRPFYAFESLCPASRSYPTDPYADQVPVYNAIYLSVVGAAYLNSFSDRERQLEEAHQLAATLKYPNPAVDVHPLELSAIALADAYLQHGVFEQNAPPAFDYFNQTITLLEKIGPFRNAPDTARLDRLAIAYWNKGAYLMMTKRPTEAANCFSACLQTLQKLLSGLSMKFTETMLSRAERLQNQAKIDLGMARLMEGKTAEARRIFDQGVLQFKSNNNPYASGLLALAENDETSAFIEFGYIKTAEQLGEALAAIRQLADALPTQRDRILKQMQTLQAAVFRTRPGIIPEESGYWEHNRMIQIRLAQSEWDSALLHATRAREAAQTMLSRSAEQAWWRSTFMRATTYETYCLLFARQNDPGRLNQIVALSENCERMADPDNFEEQNTMQFLSTNLAHALWLRHQSGDREKAIGYYQTFLFYNNWEYLQKDFIDLHRAGIQWPDFDALLMQIKPPDRVIFDKDLKQMKGE